MQCNEDRIVLCLHHTAVIAQSASMCVATCLAYAGLALAQSASKTNWKLASSICPCNLVSLVAPLLLQLMHPVPQRQALCLCCLLSLLEATPDSLCHLCDRVSWLTPCRAGLGCRNVLMHCLC